MDGPREGACSFPHRLTAEELIAFNEEILFAARIGLPLEEGLLRAARRLHGRAGQIAGALAERLTAGESWLHAMQTAPHLFPPSYQALVEAGLRTGRLPMVLEIWLEILRLTARLRSAFHVALVYPIHLAALSYCVIVASFLIMLRPMVDLYIDCRILLPPAAGLVEHVVETRWYWAPVVPIILVLFFLVVSRFLGAGRLWRQLYSPRGMIKANSEAVFLKVLSQLLATGVSLEEALPLAATTSANRSLIEDADRLVQCIRQGSRRLPPPVRNGLSTSVRMAILSAGRREQLRQLADRRVDELICQLMWQMNARLHVLPWLLALLFGVPCLLLVAFSIFVPWAWLLQRILIAP